METVISYFTRSARRSIRDRSGAAAAEFALLAPVLMLMLFGTVQYGVMFYTYNTMVLAARNGARAAAAGTSTAGQISTAIRATMPPWVPAGTVTVSTTNIAGNMVQTSVSMPGASSTIVRFGPMPATVGIDVVMLRQP